MSDPDRDAHRDHDAPRDRDLGLDRPIDRRDFLNGLAVGIGALGASSPGAWLRDGILDASAQDYPPARTGLRGSHDGAFEDAHRVRDRMAPKEWSTPSDLPERYDLVVVGAGISGLSAAHFYQQRAGTGARILILDNHDDFGGHARRNEFTVDGTSLISYAGTQSIDTPSRYSPEAKGLLRTLGVDLQAFDTAYDQEFFETRGMKDAVFFDKETFGSDRLVLHNEGEPIRLAPRLRTYSTPGGRRSATKLLRNGRRSESQFQIAQLERLRREPNESNLREKSNCHELYVDGGRGPC